MSLCSYEWEWFNNIYAKSLYPTFRKEIQSLVEFFYRWIGPIKFKISECAIWYRYLNNRSYQRDMLHDAYPCGYKLLYTLEKVTCKTLHLWSFISTIFLSPSFKGILICWDDLAKQKDLSSFVMEIIQTYVNFVSANLRAAGST